MTLLAPEDVDLKEALKKDFRKLYVKEFSTQWEAERLVREVEIDIMDLSNTLALIDDLRKQGIEVEVDN